MFDPTVFDNLKVAMENTVYDLDNLDSRIDITQRIDRLEMSVMSREFAVQFRLREHPSVTAEIQLKADLNNLVRGNFGNQRSSSGMCLVAEFLHGNS